MDEPRLIQLKAHTEERGQLVALEAGRELPFAIRRVYYMSQMSAAHPRGFHAHRNLQQLAVCLAGSCLFIVDTGRAKYRFELSRPDIGLYIGNYMWREMHNFSPDCVLMVVASEYYSESDYIRDYTEFLAEVRSREN